MSQYWDLTFPPANQNYSRSESDLAEDSRAFSAIGRSADGQRCSDWGFLSAGLDSSSHCRDDEQGDKPASENIHDHVSRKYRVGETTLDDPEVATRCAQALGCENQQIVVEPDVTDLLPQARLAHGRTHG